MKIIEISVTPVPSYYRKELGKNAFSDNIGKQRLEWIVRARTDGGVEGITIANRAMRQGRVEDLLQLLKTSLLDREVGSLLQVQNGVVTGPGADIARTFHSHRWLDALAFDLYGKAHDVSAISLLGGKVHDTVLAYDTTFYFQDFLVPEKAAKQVAEEAAEAKAAGYRALKIKTGRGGRWMMPEAGMRRDVDVVLGVREAVGEDFQIYVDANFGYDDRLDLLENFIRETVPANIYWLEEMITHDVAGYRAMREMQAKHGSKALLVCGETDRDPISETFCHLIEDGLIDGYQRTSWVLVSSVGWRLSRCCAEQKCAQFRTTSATALSAPLRLWRSVRHLRPSCRWRTNAISPTSLGRSLLSRTEHIRCRNALDSAFLLTKTCSRQNMLYTNGR